MGLALNAHAGGPPEIELGGGAKPISLIDLDQRIGINSQDGISLAEAEKIRERINELGASGDSPEATAEGIRQATELESTYKDTLEKLAKLKAENPELVAKHGASNIAIVFCPLYYTGLHDCPIDFLVDPGLAK